MKSLLNKYGFCALKMLMAYLGFFQGLDWATSVFWLLFWGMLVFAGIGHLLIKNILDKGKSITPPKELSRFENLFNTTYDFALSLLLVFVGHPIEGFIWILLSQYTKLTMNKLARS